MIREDSIRRIQSRDTLIAFLRDELNWPVPPDLAPEEMFYDFEADELRLDRRTADSVQIRQLASFAAEQPWGIFLLETASPRLYTAHLRRILRGLAPTAQSQRSHLPAWPARNLLFIATHDYHRFTFAHFDGERAANARLSTFGWDSVDAGVRTLCEHNLPALAWPEDEADDQKWLEQWSAAFDVEAVTDKFFKEFRDLFENTKDALGRWIDQPAARHTFTQRLLNRLLFLCFLQKKRWLRAPNLPHPRTTYLFDLFQNAKAEGEEFYSAYLHDLFFSALNRPPASSADRLHDPIALKLGCVPFLNGGLFDPADALDAAGAVRMPNELFEPILGADGLLRRYNFTVMESTPLNQEVAVDPEMLGKVFETVVLASEGSGDYQAPNLRKATGSYYTPRIVVTFIVREVLKDYLAARIPGLTKGQLSRLMEIDAAGGLNGAARQQLAEAVSQTEAEAIRRQLEGVCACDPAIGSGAFALGLLHELVNLTILCETLERGKDPRLSQPNRVFELKKRFIERTIYGVDLQANAVEICKLRLWLSLIVDYEAGADLETCTEYQFERAVEGIPALPNLSYKIRRGDSLLDLVHGRPFRLREVGYSTEMQDACADLAAVHRRFFSADDLDTKRALRRDALVHRARLARLQLESQRQELTATGGTQVELFGEGKSRAQIRARESELAEIDAALREVQAIERALEPLRTRKRLTAVDDELLNRLEASREGDEITFSWELDFPEVFMAGQSAAATVTGAMRAIVNQTPGQMELPAIDARRGGFDIVVGNPPFVTARNPSKRRLYRRRWQETCYMKFQLVAPFFQRSFGLLKPGGHLGFIVSNAFAKREFGRRLVERYFPSVDLQRVVDCSGLMFPGHGTPTCVVFGRNRRPAQDAPIRVAAVQPGGGDLHTAPEDSPLWSSLQMNHDRPGYSDQHIAVADRPRLGMARWPWNWDVAAEPTRAVLESNTRSPLRELLAEDIGFDVIFGAREIFVNPTSYWRARAVPAASLVQYIEGDTLRDYTVLGQGYTLFPYDKRLRPHLARAIRRILQPWRELLENRPQLGGLSQVDFGLEWFEYYRFTKRGQGTSLAYAEIATHLHFVYSDHSRVFTQTAPLVKLPAGSTPEEYHAIAAALNSSTALFWLKLVCFSKREAEQAEADTYYVFAGGKTQQLPVTAAVLSPGLLRTRLATLSQACWERGCELQQLSASKLFEHQGEAYHAWISSLPGHVPPHPCLGAHSFRTAAGLLGLVSRASTQRETLRSQMVALQEEMDWLVYAAYGLLPPDHPAIGLDGQPGLPEPLALGERPFELLRDGSPIPDHFSPERRGLWQARLEAIHDNEHIRRIEQPIYKRRWYRKETDEQEFRRAFEWWLSEKAEWWLEHRAGGGPVALEDWAEALWQDERVRAAVEAVESSPLSLGGFRRLFKGLVRESTVPDWIPPAMPWPEVARKFKKKVPGRARRIRGKLNVPRERFRLTGDGRYLWAGTNPMGRVRRRRSRRR